MTDFITGIAVGAGLLWLVQYFSVLILQKYADKQIEELEHLIKQHDDQQKVTARVECVDGCYYVYDSATGLFLAQGRTVPELDQVLKNRWPDKLVLVSEGDKDVLKRLKSTV